MRSFFIIGVMAILSFGCSSGKKALEKGNYEKALTQSIKRLRSNGDHGKSRSTLRRAYPLALDLYQRNIAKAQVSGDPLKWETIAANYQQVNFLYDQILRCPACREVIPNPRNYDAELATAKKRAAETRYNLGVEALRHNNDRNKAIEAHQHFLVAKNYVPRYRDVDEKIREALYNATLKVVVEPIPAPMKAMELRHDFFVNKINEYLHHTTISPYVKFYTPGEARAADLEYVDHVVKMEFDRFSLGNVYSHTTEREVSRDSVEIGEKDGQKIYGTVKAKLKVNEKSIVGGGVLDFKILDNDARKVLSQEKFPSEYKWSVQWATYNGDERALDDEELEMVKRSEASIPGPQMMFEEFTAPLYDQVIRKFRDFYARF